MAVVAIRVPAAGMVRPVLRRDGDGENATTKGRVMLYLFDLDGTLIEGFLAKDADGKIVAKYDQPYERVVVRPHVLEKLSWLASCGHDFAIVTNQGGVALGYQSPTEVWTKMGAAVRAVGSFYGRPYSLHVAMHHEDAKVADFDNPHEVARRKPEPTMLFEAIEFHGYQYGGAARAQLGSVVMVGDMESDKIAADHARPYVRFEWADDFFQPLPDDVRRARAGIPSPTTTENPDTSFAERASASAEQTNASARAANVGGGGGAPSRRAGGAIAPPSVRREAQARRWAS